jgi:integrase
VARKKAAVKRPRRKPGTGTVREKKGRSSPWEAEFPTRFGEHRYDYFDTRLDATAHLDRLVEERDSKEQPRNISGGSQRVEPFLIAFLNRKRIIVGPKTLSDYTYQCTIGKKYIGNLRVDEVDREIAEAMFAHLHDQGYKNLAQLRMVLKQAFTYAVEEDYIRRNPFAKIELPTTERRKNIALTVEERQRLLDVLVDDPLEGLFHIFSRLGARFGEGLALMWVDINWEMATITIARHYVSIKGKTILRPDTKNKQIRIIPVPRDLLEILQRLSVSQRQRVEESDDWEEHGLIFPSERGTPRTQRNVMRLFKEGVYSIVNRAQLSKELTIHDLRHTAAYIMEQQKVPRSVRMSLLGHLTAAMADHYADHASADMQAMRAAVEKNQIE